MHYDIFKGMTHGLEILSWLHKENNKGRGQDYLQNGPIAVQMQF